MRTRLADLVARRRHRGAGRRADGARARAEAKRVAQEDVARTHRESRAAAERTAEATEALEES